MRLSKIKLAGFKSFVDATTVPLPGPITAVVGPNGCGKSNIIDAVRWVMGESSAKHLRGGSMADVIFSGSNSRKPVGLASIELVFDNSEGSLGGQYAGYSEISVRRQVNRNGQSAYYLNGTRCRRRDITDVFLGTGLGPRSYSIIEQGTISRLIEARPEELRGYLEEAAGISLYKERRRETERRIRDTLDNLERLEDVRDEVGRQLEKLGRQAETAERYRALKAEEARRRGELLLLRRQGLEAERERLRGELNERENALQEKIARQRALEREAETLRARHAEDSDRLNEIQGRYYGLGSDIARIEQRIAHRRELRESSQRELERNREALGGTERELEDDREKQAVLLRRLEELEPALEDADERLETAEAEVRAARQRLDAWRERWDALTEAAATAGRNAQVERTRIEQLEARLAEQQRRRERLAAEAESLAAGGDDALETWREEAETLAEDRAELQAQLDEVQQRLGHQRNQLRGAEEEAELARAALGEDRARLASLTTLQEAALGADAELARWLESLGLQDAERLGERLQVTPGWEQAVEAVLGDALQARVVSEAALDAGQAAALGHGRAMLFAGGEASGAAPAPAVGTPLRELVSAPWPLDDLLAAVYAAEDDAEAERLLARLGPEASVVTPDGRWRGRRWIRVRAADDGAGAGVLARGREIERLREAIGEHEERLAAAEAAAGEARQALESVEAQREDAAAELAELDQRLAGLQARIEGEERRQRERGERRAALAEEREDLAEALESGEAEVRAARRRLEAALEEGERLDGERERLNDERLAHQDVVDRAREAAEAIRAERHDLALRLESASTARQSLEEAIARLERQRGQLEARNRELDAALAEVADPDDSLEQERQDLLARRLEVEGELGEARSRLEAADHRLRELEQARSAVEAEVTELRGSAESARYRDYELQARLQTLDEQLGELDLSRADLAEGLPQAATEAEWEAELERLDARIRRLGPINLAAIDEHQALSERKGYLDAQQADLSEALETLQDAIQRIDRETRNRFRDTFDKVNAGLQRLFPRLFGGGQAYLEMTDDDLLETGVTIMARPPGKRITNIHLLSGGEKALTAVSLVFAIFELNPAPFCMLDEVDAPLDEANVGRFCELLGQMSGQVQFVVITHNKTTMEAASHLAGVTMAEPGVSRLVAVDVEGAVELADA
ncbi:chromosome segregation protein SMC [Sediminicurvatus halobius]|uniref:Chromosome partition protein Smc n=1 Tax=Sediminicurvatus halobius TaxID=2182432 RepID=A0A2U2N324_9GAMM|nr:chromosome segregation protein SMC [Spiribacter halobius]PWG63500.1 chromosome segregation protein SMC [Spiribacter halobius]UEX79629.1 chromosome segregation protein SMC [Spiribacter halobius]